MLGADPQRDNYVYQLWLFYEIIDLLKRAGRLTIWDIARQSLWFTWGDATDSCAYRVQHDQQIATRWNNAPGVRPDFYVERVDRIEIMDGTTLIWREPGYIIDAKYYRPRETGTVEAMPVKRMLADLQLTEECHAALVFAFTSFADDAATVQPMPAAQRAWHDSSIKRFHYQPTDDQQTEQHLRQLLNEIHTTLHQRVEVRCHGVFLNALGTNAHGELANLAGVTTRHGQLIDAPLDDLLLCPKPHVAPGRVDLVSRSRDCVSNPWLCHVWNHPAVMPPMRTPRTADELLDELQHLFTNRPHPSDEDVSLIAQQIETVTRRFAEIAGAYQQLDIYYNRLRDLGLAHTLDLLEPTEQESLALAMFLVEKLDSVNAHDYSAPAIHLSSVMEVAIKRRFFATPLYGTLANPKKHTLGVLPYIRRKPEESEGNWQRIVDHVQRHWDGHIDPDDPQINITFEAFIDKTLNRISQLRNTSAHTEVLSRQEYSELQRLTCQTSKLGAGALPILLLAWHDTSTPNC